MSKVNFLKIEYRIEPQRNDAECGIVDGPESLPAFSTIDRGLKWNATIVNPDRRSFQFVPVDKNIIVFKENGLDKESTCDGMLLVDNTDLIAFIELKDVNAGGFSDAVGQLENTIKLFLQNHKCDVFRKRRAYAANIAHPQFHYNMKDDIERFRTLKFALYPEATINFSKNRTSSL